MKRLVPSLRHHHLNACKLSVLSLSFFLSFSLSLSLTHSLTHTIGLSLFLSSSPSLVSFFTFSFFTYFLLPLIREGCKGGKRMKVTAKAGKRENFCSRRTVRDQFKYLMKRGAGQSSLFHCVMTCELLFAHHKLQMKLKNKRRRKRGIERERGRYEAEYKRRR